jgi:hypothetical protein
MPAWLAQQDDENVYEARAKTLVNHAFFCPWHPLVISTTYSYFLRSSLFVVTAICPQLFFAMADHGIH